VNEIKNIIPAPSDGPMRVAAGEHFAEPAVIEAGSRSVHLVLEAGARVHLTAFVLAVGGAAKGTVGETTVGETTVGETTVGEEATSNSSGTLPMPNTSGEASNPNPSGASENVIPGEGNKSAYYPSGPARLSLEVDLAGEGAEFHLHALYVASGAGESAGRADIDVRVNHLVPGCVSRQLIKGVAAGTATGSFAGMVHVAPGALHTDAVQRNQNLQLSDTAHIFTRPQLEIYADDVQCSHCATIGRLDEEAVYYMRQRGVSEAEARRMQLQGFAGEIINHCPSEGWRKTLAVRIGAIIDRL
jgi:hypothetical protein